MARDDWHRTRARDHRAKRGGYRRPAGRALVPSRVDVVDRLDAEGLLPAIMFIFSRAGCDAAVQQALNANLRLTSPAERREILAYAESRVVDAPGADLDVLGYPQLARGARARHLGAPCRHAARLQGVRRGAVLPRPGQDGVRHRDARPRHQHAGPVRGDRPALEVERRDARRRDPGGVHPADRAGRPAGHRRRGPRRRAVGARASTPRRSPAWPRPGPTRCARRSGRRTTWRSTWCSRSARRRRASCSSRRSPSSRPTGPSSGWRARCVVPRRASPGTPRTSPAAKGDFMEYASLEAPAHRHREVGAAQDAWRPVGGGRGVAGPAQGRRRHHRPGRPMGRAGAGPRPRGALAAGRSASAGADARPAGQAALAGRLPDPGRAGDQDPGSRRRSTRATRSSAASSRWSCATEPGTCRRSRTERPTDAGPGAEDPEIARLREQIRAHPCHSCPDRENHARWAERYLKLERETNTLRRRIEQRTNTIAREFDRVCEVLEELGYLDGDMVTPAGSVALAAVQRAGPAGRRVPAPRDLGRARGAGARGGAVGAGVRVTQARRRTSGRGCPVEWCGRPSRR